MTDNQGEHQPHRLVVESAVVDAVRVVTVRGEIDHEVKDMLGDALMSEDQPLPPRIVVDLSGVSFMDSSGINVFITAHRRVTDSQGWLRIAAAQEPVLRILRLVGLDSLIDCHPTIEQAMNA
ncbi:STAS domain-containing protein [Streptomyces cucumeris]|uniref:STAS domain-containing protein n=1 Tax=Streptomyces cucumeris TaxID=2962890 RepID=UPI003D72EBA9